MAITLPAEHTQRLIVSTADLINQSEIEVMDALSHFVGHDITDVLEAMELIHSCDVAVLRAYLDGSDLLDEQLDDWLAPM
jgi:hypothetical protein